MVDKLEIQIASDLHIERLENVNALDLITPSSKILILAGDIGSLYKWDQLYTFLNELSSHFKHILYVPGNHEFYRINDLPEKRMNKLINDLYKLEEKIDNLIIMNKKTVIIRNFCIIGCTLWSKSTTKKIPHYIVKNNYINKQYNQIHQIELQYIKKQIKKHCKKTIIVVTHHSPTYSILKYYPSLNRLKGETDPYSSLYASNLDNLLNSEYVHTWICGHTHRNFDLITKGGTHFVSNQKGKPKDKIDDYLPKKTIYL